MIIVNKGSKFCKVRVPLIFKSKRFISFINFRFLNPENFDRKPKSLKSTKKSDVYTFFRFSRIYPFLSGKRFGVYTGKNFHSFITTPLLCGSSLSKFVPTIKARTIVLKSKKNLKSKKKK